MKITNIRLRQLTGTMEVDGPFMEERLAMPLDVYEEFRVQGPPAAGTQVDDSHYQLNQIFVQIDTDEGVSGIAGPTQPGGTAFHVWQMRDFLIGRDPLATEFLWDIMHRKSVHGRQGEPMMAISLIDNALWDLKGKWFKQSVSTLIGGGGRGPMPAYASMLGYATQDLGLVKERALEMQSRGYKAQKWFFRHGPMSGPEGFKKNVAMVETIRETLGDDDDIMLDCWQSMDVNYVVRLAEAIEDLHPRWLEEVAMPDRIDSYRKIREATNIPISGAEHEYTRWGFKRFIDAEALDIIQPDLNWAGGLSEVMKISALATTYDLITICHQGVSPPGMAWSSAQSPIHTPYVEMLVKHAAMSYFFDANGGPNFSNGELTVSEHPGLGFDIDESKIESQSDLEY
jgi:L-rhamnonate dehydratase